MSAIRRNNPPSFRARVARGGAVCFVLLAALWVVHPFVLDRTLRWSLARVASQSGLRLEVGKIHAAFSRPFVFENIRLRAKDPVLSRTAANIERMELSWNWPWQIAFGPKRAWRKIACDGVRGIFDFRPEALSAPVWLSATTGRGKSDGASAGLMFFPEEIQIQRATVEFLAPSHSLYFQDAAVTLSEKEIGKFQTSGAELHLGQFRRTFGMLEGITAWKGGSVHVADLLLLKGLKIEDFHVDFLRSGGVGLGLGAEVFGGSLRGDLTFIEKDGVRGIDAALWATNINLEPMPALFAVQGECDGVLHEGRFTFRGAPERATGAEASLRLSAHNFRWNKRGWESLQIGASLIHQRLAISDLVLRQKDNELRGNGEVSLAAGWAGLSQAPFLLNISASIKDVNALAGLFGTPFDEMKGRMSLVSSVSGRAGKVDGFLDLEASAVNYRNRPIESAKFNVTFSNNEAQVTRCELWSGKDYLRAHGALDMAAPYRYSGDMEAQAADVAGYVGLFCVQDTPSVYAGSLKAHWQGDGTFSAHSGAFNVFVEDFVSERTPAGLTGRFEGTYSPQNIYFSAFELLRAPLRFFTKATLAESGVTLGDLTLKSGGRQIADGEFFLPFNPFAMTGEKRWLDAVDLTQPVYALFHMREELALQDLLRLMGKPPSARGTLRINLQVDGPFSQLAGQAKIEGRGLARKFRNGFSPASALDVTIRAEKGAATVDGSLVTPGSAPATLAMQMPLGLVETVPGTRKWINPTDPISGKLSLPQVELAALQLVLPGLFPMSGKLSGELAIGGTPAQPQIGGGLEIRGGRMDFSPLIPAIGRFDAAIWFNGNRAILEKCAGDLGGGAFELRGGLTFSNPANPQYDLAFNGSKILLADDAGLKLRTDGDLIALGDNSGGSLKGSIRLVNGQFFKRLEITPVITSSPLTDQAVLTAPNLAGLLPPSFAGWMLDVSIRNASPFKFGGSRDSGEILPELRLLGTIGHPLLDGHVEIKNARVFLPFTTMVLESGRVDFFENKPWIPHLEVRGHAQALNYKVQAYAFGPMNERRLILRSDPPLSQEALTLLLTTGIAPGIYEGRLGPDTAVRNGSSPLHPFGTALDAEDSGMTSLFNPIPSSSPGDATLNGRLRLWEGLSLAEDSDDKGFSGVTYRLRLR